MAKLVIDLEKFKDAGDPNIRCSYKHHPENKGFDYLLERVRFALICRKCTTAPCVKSCPKKALEKVSIGGTDDVLKRANMLCTGCGTCSIACPFGTIYAELIPFPSSICDVCRNRLQPGEKPLCVRTCSNGGIDYKNVSAGGDLVEVFEDIVVNVPSGTRWEPFLRDTGRPRK